MEERSIQSIMTRSVQWMPPSTSLSVIVEAMKENCHSCMIITEGESPIGVITERDIVQHHRIIAEGKSSLSRLNETLKVARKMTPADKVIKTTVGLLELGKQH